MLRFKNTYNFLGTSRKYLVFSCKNQIFEVRNFLLFLITIATLSCHSQQENSIPIPGANSTEFYLQLLKNKNIGIVANQTTVIYKNQHQTQYTHLVDSLVSLQIPIKKVFSPEHGFRGKADASEHVSNGVDSKTGIPIISLYGKNKKPTSDQLKDLDLVVFDIQDVGVRFYTYISTLHYVMEACAEHNIPVIVLDRPNPNGHYIDGPTLDIEYRSFVGMHPVPLVYGMTIGEYAQMIDGENWLKNNVVCDLTVIPLRNYTHKSEYNLPIRPSPNLPNAKSINLYPSLGFFEGTPINAGRGTEYQFQRYGSSKFTPTDFAYFPKANFGSKYPKDKDKKCYGYNLLNEKHLSKVNIVWLKNAFEKYPDKKAFFGNTFTIHAGNQLLQKQLEEDVSIKEIEDSWKKNIEEFKIVREKYLLYD